MLQKSTSFNIYNIYNGILIVVKMALKALKQPKTESFKIQIEAKATSTDFEWQSEALASLSEAEREEFEERAAIMEYDGGFSREEAERLAIERILEKRGNLNGTKNSLGFF